MPKITSIEELTKLKKAVEPRLAIRQDANFSHFKATPEICIQQCRGMGCTAAGGDKVTELFEDLIKKKGLDSKINIVRTGCLGPAKWAPRSSSIPAISYMSGSNPKMYRKYLISTS